MNRSLLLALVLLLVAPACRAKRCCCPSPIGIDTTPIAAPEAPTEAADAAAEDAWTDSTHLVIEIHVIADLSKALSAEVVRESVLDQLVLLVDEPAPVIKLQGTGALIVKARPRIQDQVASVLDEMRGNLLSSK